MCDRGGRSGSDNRCILGEQPAALDDRERADMINVGVREKHRVDLTAIDTAEIRVLGDVTLFESAVDEIVVLSGLDMTATAPARRDSSISSER